MIPLKSFWVAINAPSRALGGETARFDYPTCEEVKKKEFKTISQIYNT
jgi:hypothetical protein